MPKRIRLKQKHHQASTVIVCDHCCAYTKGALVGMAPTRLPATLHKHVAAPVEHNNSMKLLINNIMLSSLGSGGC